MFATNVVLLVLFDLCVLCRAMPCLTRVAGTRLVNNFVWFFSHSVTVTQIVDEHCCADGRYTLGQPFRMVLQTFGDSDTIVDEHCCADR